MSMLYDLIAVQQIKLEGAVRTSEEERLEAEARAVIRELDFE